jgi:putative aldouronate transport system permease protein
MLFVCFATLYPFLHVIAVSLSGRFPVARGEVTFYPKDITLNAYQKILESKALFRSYANTILIVVAGTILSVFFISLAAYPLSKKKLPGNRLITFLLTITLWFNAGMIPQFFVVQRLGLYDSLWSLILTPLISAYYVIVMRNFFENMPSSLEESARLDGCTDIGILFRIIYPLSLPVLSTVALWVAVAHWNSFFEPLLYLKSREKYTIQLALRDIILANSANEYNLDVDPMIHEFEVVTESVQYATIIAATLPILVVYPFLQKYFVKGVLVGAIKG